MPRGPQPDRHKQPRRAPSTSAIDGPFCGAPCRNRADPNHHCRQPAGWRTDHPGQGHCNRHGGVLSSTRNAKLKTGRYSTIVHRTVRDAMDQMAQIETDVMDLVPEANLLRALTVDYINRYQEFSEALLAWYADSDPDADSDSKSRTKPRKIMDLSDAGRLVEAISRVVARIHQVQSTGAISLETFRRVTEMMGVTVATHIRDESLLSAIESDWSSIALDAKQIYAHDWDDPEAIRRSRRMTATPDIDMDDTDDD